MGIAVHHHWQLPLTMTACAGSTSASVVIDFYAEPWRTTSAAAQRTVQRLCAVMPSHRPLACHLLQDKWLNGQAGMDIAQLQGLRLLNSPEQCGVTGVFVLSVWYSSPAAGIASMLWCA